MWKKPTWALPVATLLTACGSGPLGTVDNLERNLERWRAQEIDSYTYDYQLSCFCAGPAIQPVTIEVRAGELFAVTSRETGEPVDPEIVGDFPSVEDLFEEIREALRREPFRFEATYHATLGYPQEMFVDFEERVDDDERSFTASNLQETDPAP